MGPSVPSANRRLIDTELKARWRQQKPLLHRPGHRGWIKIRTGITVFNWDLSELLYSHGPNALLAAVYEGDPHALDQICAALGAS